MDKDVVKFIAVGIAGYYVGRIVSDYKIMKRRTAIVKRQTATRENSEFWLTIQRYLNNPNDNRTVEQMVKDWQDNLETHKKFNEIINGE